MGLFEKLFPRQTARRQVEEYFKTLTAYRPVFTSWHGAIYESELVRAAIDTRARHISKMSVAFTGAAKPYLQSKLKIAPNEWQTWSQFLYRLSTILDNQNSAFIVPVFGQYGEVTGMFPVLPSKCEIVETADGVPYLRYTFITGEKASIERELCGLMTKFQYKDDFFGESNSALTPTMDLIHTQDQGIKEAIKNGATFRFMAKLNNFSKPEDLAKERKRFSRENFEAEDGGGLLLFPNTYADIQQIKSTPFTVDADQMNAIKENVFNYFGVNEAVLQNKATDEQLDSFFDGSIEPFSIQLSQVLENMLFTNREISVGNHVYVAANRLQYMSTTHKINMAQQLGDRGMITINEVRELFNYPPLPEGGDKAPIRGEYYFAGEEKTDGNDGQN